MLTREAQFEREWGRYPELGRVLTASPGNFYDTLYPSSVSSNAFDELRTSAINAAHAIHSLEVLLGHVRAAGSADERRRRLGALVHDLHSLMAELQGRKWMLDSISTGLRQAERDLEIEGAKIVRELEHPPGTTSPSPSE